MEVLRMSRTVAALGAHYVTHSGPPASGARPEDHMFSVYLGGMAVGYAKTEANAVAACEVLDDQLAMLGWDGRDPSEVYRWVVDNTPTWVSRRAAWEFPNGFLDEKYKRRRTEAW